MNRDEIVLMTEDFIGSDVLAQAARMDELGNGIQLSGADVVTGIALGTSLNVEFLEQAAAKHLNFCITHHGFDFRTWKSRLPRYAQERLRIIYANSMTIAGYHCALDIQPEIGNNAMIVKKLGAKPIDTFFEGWGITARFAYPQNITDLKESCRKLFRHDIFSTLTGPDAVSVIGVCSGGAKPHAEHLAEMESKGIELFITGETTESAPHKMKESRINYFVCGHYATEVFGIQALAKKLKKKLGNSLPVEFIDIPNPV